MPHSALRKVAETQTSSAHHSCGRPRWRPWQPACMLLPFPGKACDETADFGTCTVHTSAIVVAKRYLLRNTNKIKLHGPVSSLTWYALTWHSQRKVPLWPLATGSCIVRSSSKVMHLNTWANLPAPAPFFLTSPPEV